MASINKLSIRGVRSFSPDDAEQVVEFYCPCTIIVGSNGCGKTTIIESLKYAVCGTMPPGNKSGQAFVHDPRSIGQSVVKANVKLRFTNRAGKSMVVVRSMEVTQKKVNMTFKQLDGVIRTVDDQGNRQSSGHKCSELDKQIPTLMGVSKPILDHVIFCHQEDASWPLQEGAVLKKRFDDIFDSARYSKALEVFAKSKKEYASKAKDLKADLAGLASHKHAAKAFRRELEQYSNQLEEVEEEMDQINSSLKTTEKEQARLRQIMEQVEDAQNEIESLHNERARRQAVIKKQRHMLEEDLTATHSIRELKDQLRDFDQAIGKQIERRDELQDDVKRKQEECESLRKQESSLTAEMGRLSAEQESHEKRLKRRHEIMTEIGEKYGLSDVLTPFSQTQTQNTSFASTVGDSSMLVSDPNSAPESNFVITHENLQEFYRTLEKKEEELQENLTEQRSRMRSQDDELQSAIADLIGRQKAIDRDRNKVQQELTEARQELHQLSTKLSGTSRLRKADVDEAKHNAEKYGRERDQATNDPRRGEIAIEIRSCEKKIDNLKHEIEDDQLALRDLRRDAEAQHSITVLKEQFSKDIESLQEQIEESSYALRGHGIAIPSDIREIAEDEKEDKLTTALEEVVDAVTSKLETAKGKLVSATEEVSRIQRFVSEKNALLSQDNHTLGTKSAQLNQLEGAGGSLDKIRKVASRLKNFEDEMGKPVPDYDETTPKELLSYLDTRLEQEEAESVEGIQYSTVRKVMLRLKKQAKKIGGSGNVLACPCCDQALSSSDVLETFMDKIALYSSEDSPLLKTDEKNRTARSQYQKWRQVVSDRLNDALDYQRVKAEVAELERRAQELSRGLSEKKSELDKAKDHKKTLDEDVTELRSALEIVKRWAESASRIVEKRMQVSQKQFDLSMNTSDGAGRDLTTVEQQLNEHLEEKDRLINKINQLNKEMTLLNDRLSKVSSQAAKFEKISRDKIEKFAKEKEDAERKIVLNEKIKQNTDEEKKLQDQIAPILQKIRSKETEKQRMRSLASEEEERLSETLSAFKSEIQNLKEVTKLIDEFEASDKNEELAVLKAKAESLASSEQDKLQEIEHLQPELDRLKKAIEDQERHKKNLKENIELIREGEKTKDLDDKIAKLEEESANIEGHDTCSQEYENQAEQKQELISSKARLEGRRGEIVESQRSLKRKLSTPEYKNVDEEHRVAMIKYETTQMAVRDIEKYHAALDKALLRFHSIKIAEINTIIRELWSLTYKGEDITNIEIVSGQEAGSRASRSYNYRVVMSKGSTQMDMRGRCSAGQRVLASIVIRLALAETFCVNCGCIALDEPTVNLDYNNKRGLAAALSQIIAARSQQSNFQLIAITHDEDFVALLKTELSTQTGFSMPEKYFQVRREEGTDGKFYSKIDAIDWDELV